MAKRFFSEQMPGLLLFFLTLAIYLILPNRNYSYDSVSYAWFIRSAHMLFHPHHLLYNPLGFLILRGLSSSGIQASPMVIMQVINSLVGALGVLLFFRILHRLSQDRFISIASSVLLAFSFSYWYQSVENEVHIIPLVLLLYMLSRMVSISLGDSQLTHSSLLRLGAVGSLAVLFHQLHLLFIPVTGFFIGNEVRQLRRGVRLLLWYLAPYPFLVGGAYLLAARFAGALSDWSSFSSWSTLYASSHPRGLIGLTNFRLAAYGIPRAFLRATFLKNLLLNRTIGAGGIALLFGSCLAAFILVYVLWLTVRRFKSLYSPQPTVYSLLLAWLSVYGIFALWWEPHNPEFWLPLLPPFWILLSSGTRGTRKAMPSLLLASIFAVNLVGEAIPNSSLKNNEPYQLMLKLRAEGFGSRDLILMPDPLIEPYYLYFFDEGAMVSSLADMKSPTEEERARVFIEVTERIEKALLRGAKVFVSQSELEPNPRKLHPTRWLKASDYRDFYRKYEDRLRKVFSYKWDGEEVDMFELEG